MRKVFIGMMIFAFSFVLLGCSRTEMDYLNDFVDSINKMDSYEFTADVVMNEHDKEVKLTVEGVYKKPDLIKVKITNKENNHVQVLIKNPDGVFVLTPAANKVFKFQSDWPLNSSTSYILQSLIKDIVNDDTANVKEEMGKIIINSKVNYKMNRALQTQKIEIDAKKLYPLSVTVYDGSNNPKIVVTFTKFSTNTKIDDSEFEPDEILERTINELGETVVNLEVNYVYPSIIPEGSMFDNETKLSSSIIVTYKGDKAFTVIESKIVNTEQVSTNIVAGEPILVNGIVVNVMSQGVNFIYGGLMVDITSNNLDVEEYREIICSLQIQGEK